MSEHLNHALIKVFMSSRKNYEKYSGFVKTKLLSEHEKELFYSLKAYYNEFRELDQVDTSDYFMWFSHVKHADLDDIQLSQYRLILSRVEEVSTGSIKSLVKKFQESQFKENLKQYLEVGNDPDKIAKICEDYKQDSKLVNSPELLYLDMSVANVYNEEAVYGHYNWRLDFLNNNLGKLHRGMLGLVYAYVDTGKTSFLASELTYIASQLSGSQTIVWLNYEGDEIKISHRLYCAGLNTTDDKILTHSEYAQTKYNDMMKGDKNRIKIVNARGFNLRKIAQTLDTYKPVVLVIDQLTNIPMKASATVRQEYSRISKAVRELSVKYDCAIIVTAQASSNVKYQDKYMKTHCKRQLDLSDLYESKVAIQANIDYAIGIGVDVDTPDNRYLTVTKSKQSRPGGTGIVNFNSYTARYEDTNL